MSQLRAARVSWVLAAVFAAGAVLVLLGRTPPEPAAAPATEPAVAGAETAPALAARTPAELVHDHEHTTTTEVSETHELVPPPPDAEGDDTNPPIEPEQPQTPEWRLAKTTRLVTMVGERVGRLEERLAEASARGDAAAAAEARILLERTRRRLTALERDVEALEQAVGGEGGRGGGEAAHDDVDGDELSPAEAAR